MSDDFEKATSAIAKLHQEMEALNRLASPSYLGVTEQMERALETIRRQHLEVSRNLEMSGAAARMQGVIDANHHWQDLIGQSDAVSGIADHIAVHQSWLERLGYAQHDFPNISQLQASAKLALCDTSLRLTVTERLIAGLDYEALLGRFHLEGPLIAGLDSSIAHMTGSYGSLADSLRNLSDITRLPDFVLPGATREIYTTNFALETLRPLEERDEEEAETEIQLVAEVELETSGCIALLQQVDPRLARPYIGARDALYSNNADRARHILSSLRELWNHLLRRLAPDALVMAWVPDVPHQKDLLHEGKPTRRARVLYVCRELDSDPLTDFLIHDTRALVKLIELFNRVHELETKLTDEQLRAILLKTDSWLIYILQIWNESIRK